MRLRLIYLYRNLTRNPLRSLLTCAAVALPVMIFVLSRAVISGVESFLDNSQKQLRLAVTHKLSVINPLPAGHRPKIESLDPDHTLITSVCGVRWIGGTIDNDPRYLSTLGCDADSFAATFPERGLTQDQIDAWLRDRTALIVGYKTAGQFGWKTGDHITIRPSVPPYTPMQFNIVSAGYEGDPDPEDLWCRCDYIEEELRKIGLPADHRSFFFVKCVSKPALEEVARGIDAMFANTPDPTKSQDEKAFMNEFISQQLNLPRNLAILCAVVVSVAALAAANTMSMNFRDRMNELATLKSLGFRNRFCAFLITTESMLLCGLGGLIGAGLPYIAFTFTPARDFYLPVIHSLRIDPLSCVLALLVALAIGLVAGIWPAWLAVRLRVVSALRSLE